MMCTRLIRTELATTENYYTALHGMVMKRQKEGVNKGSNLIGLHILYSWRRSGRLSSMISVRAGQASDRFWQGIFFRRSVSTSGIYMLTMTNHFLPPWDDVISILEPSSRLKCLRSSPPK